MLSVLADVGGLMAGGLEFALEANKERVISFAHRLHLVKYIVSGILRSFKVISSANMKRKRRIFHLLVVFKRASSLFWELSAFLEFSLGLVPFYLQFGRIGRFSMHFISAL